jgi:hypothetical protein
MRANCEPESYDPLLDAVLRDERWASASATGKAQALGAFRARQRLRRLTRVLACLPVVAVLIAGLVYWFGPRTAPPAQITVARNDGPKALEQPRYLTDAELLARFPKGSCFIAEVEGRKELVFLNPEMGRRYLAQPGVRGN